MNYEALHGVGAVLFNIVTNLLFLMLGMTYSKFKDEEEK